MLKPEEHEIYVIPPNFIEGGTLFGGLFKTRNAIEAGVIGILVGVPVFSLPFSLTAKIIILCLTALPLVLASAVMGAVSYGAYWLLTWVVSPRVAVIPAILVAILVYALCAVLFRGVGYEDVAALPKGHTLARLLRMKPEEPPRRREAPLPAEELPLEKAASSGAASEERKAPPSRKAPSRGRGKYVPRHMR